MVRENKIKELTNDKIVPIIDRELKKYGFKYQKSKKQFVRQKSGISQIINITISSSSIFYVQETEQIYLAFTISSKLEIPDYETWYLEKFGQSVYFSCGIEKIVSKIELSFDDFDNESFYEPSASQKFKRNILFSLTRGDSEQKNIIPISDILETKISNLISNLDDNSNILQIHKNRQYPFEHIYLLVFGGYEEITITEFQKCYQYLISEIEIKIKVSESEARNYLRALNELIKNSQIVTNLSFSNPFKRTIKITRTQNDIFEFSSKTKFSEILRLDISQFEVISVNVNPIGDIVLFSANQMLIKFNSKGELVFEKEIETKKGFNKLLWYGHTNFVTGVISGTNIFYVNNFIITDKNEVLELPLPLNKLKKGRLQDINITDFAFCKDLNQYLIIYQNSFIRFNIEGQVEQILNIENNYAKQIILEKKWILTQQRDKANVILDFEGNHIGTYEYDNANNNYAFSNNFDKLLCFFYSTKSQLYDLTSSKKETLWAHPTYIKDYREVMYGDIHNNFGMDIANFSPDNKFIVGGAEHGKYVAWILPKLDRIELIPKTEVIDLFKPHISTSYYEGKSEESITKAEVVTLENHKFLKNRGYNISKIIFFEDGDIFVTELGYGAIVLSWDREFNNLTYKKTDGRVNFHSQKYLTQISEKELVIYEQQ